ncbi:FlhC family transcriptional regulator [Eoetvoesiella caeni]
MNSPVPPRKPIPQQQRTSISSKDEIEAVLRTRSMLISGYVTQIIQIETGLTQKRVRSISHDLQREGLFVERRSRTLRSSKTIIQGQASKVHASILMVLYQNLGGSPTINTINTTALTKSYSLYLAILQELPESDQKSWGEKLSISDAWALAREIRTKDAAVLNCKSCKAEYFEAVHESTNLDCPFCRPLFPSSMLSNQVELPVSNRVELTA